MLNKKIIYSPLLLGCLLSMTSCFDDKYDLDDIDTTSAIKLDNLIVPVRLETIELNDVLKIDDEDPDNPVVVFTASDGSQYYAIRKNGEFEADPVYIDMIDATSYASISNLPVGVTNGEIQPASIQFEYLIGSGKVDSSIIKVNRLGMNEANPMNIDLRLSYQGSLSLPVVQDLVIVIPKTFTAYYKGQEVVDGRVNVTIKDGQLDQPIKVYAMDFEEEGGIIPGPDRSLEFTGKIGVASGKVPSGSEGLSAQFSMSPFTADMISGEINYEIEAPEIEPVSLGDLPDFLAEGETNLIISNPQLYLYFGNPVGAPFTGDLKITPYGNGGKGLEETLNPFNETIILAANINDLALVSQYPGAVAQEAKDLQTILSGSGLPESIEFKLDNTFMRGVVPNLSLGTDMQINGNYTFFAPLAFEANSQIIYSKKENDFFGDDMKDIEVELLELSCSPETNLPFELTLILYPLDKEGNYIKDASGNVIMAQGHVSPYANGSQDLTLQLRNFSGLDGVEYRVVVDNMNGETLKPSQTITLNNIRAKVTGKYVTDFGD